MNSTRSIVAAARITAKPLKTIPRSWTRHSSNKATLPISQTPRSQHASRSFRTQGSRKNTFASLAKASNPAMAFPCLDALKSKYATLEARSLSSGLEPSYISGVTLNYQCREPLLLDWGGVLPEFNTAYGTWGEINADKSNVILLHTGLSASSHAHSTEKNSKPGWWERFLGLNGCLDTSKYFTICTNIIRGYYPFVR